MLLAAQLTVQKLAGSLLPYPLSQQILHKVHYQLELKSS